MDEKGVKPEDIRSVDDLKYLPFMEKTDLRDYYPFDLLASPQSEIVRIQGSSGTTGKPIVSGYTENDVEVWTRMVARAMASIGADEDVVISSNDKTVIKKGPTGEQNLFNSRIKTAEMFNQLSAGKHSVIWSGAFEVDVILYQRRSEPPWI